MLTIVKLNVAARCRGEPQDQMEIREQPKLQQKRIFTVAKIRGPNLLEHETLDIEGGAVAILGKEEERTVKDPF